MATITMNAAKVAAAAEDVIAHCNHIRNLRDEATIAEVMETERKAWWKPWQKPYKLNREQAIAWLEADAEISWTGYWRSTYGYTKEEKAKSLLLMAQHGDPVILDEASVYVLFGDWRKEK